MLSDKDDDDDRTLYEATPSPCNRPRLASASDVVDGSAGNEEGGNPCFLTTFSFQGRPVDNRLHLPEGAPS